MLSAAAAATIFTLRLLLKLLAMILSFVLVVTEKREPALCGIHFERPARPGQNHARKKRA
jgi:hypothetical protein